MTNPNLAAAALKPCPFCSHTIIEMTNYTEAHTDIMHCIECQSCGAMIEREGTNSEDTWPDAISAWNRRDAAERGGDAHQITDEDVRVANIRDTIDALGALRKKAQEAMRELETCELPSWLKKEEKPIEISDCKLPEADLPSVNFGKDGKAYSYCPECGRDSRFPWPHTIEISDAAVQAALKIYGMSSSYIPPNDSLEGHKRLMRAAITAAFEEMRKK